MKKYTQTPDNPIETFENLSPKRTIIVKKSMEIPMKEVVTFTEFYEPLIDISIFTRRRKRPNSER